MQSELRDLRLARGLSRAEMAETLVVSPHTVEDHVKNLYESSVSPRDRSSSLASSSTSTSPRSCAKHR